MDQVIQPLHTLQQVHPIKPTPAKEHSLQLTNVVVLFQFAQVANGSRKICQNGKSQKLKTSY